MPKHVKRKAGMARLLELVIISHMHLFLLPVIIFLAGGAADYGAFALAALFGG